MTLSDQSSICSRPFQWCEVHPDGSVFLCCPAWLKRPIGNLLRQSVEQVWNGPVAQEIRKTVFNGSFHNCNRKRCPHLHEISWPVQTRAALASGDVRQAIINQTAQLDFLPTQLNLCFDHSCNLACPSCRNQILQATGSELKQAEMLASIVSEQLLPSAEIVTLSGFGDPFGSQTYRQLLRQLNRTDLPRLQAVRLHTNGQLLTPEMWASLPELQALTSEIEISLDAATATTYQLNRPGGSFEKLLQNLDFISSQNCQMSLSMVVQQNNWREIPRLVSMAEPLGARIYLSQLVNWGTFSRGEFLQRAVHLPQHPEYRDCKQLIKQVASLAAVDIGNLAARRE